MPDLNLAEDRRSCGHERLSANDWKGPRLFDPDSFHRNAVASPGRPEHSLSWEARLELREAYCGALGEKHLQAYLDEFAFRHVRALRESDTPTLVFEGLLANLPSTPDLTYRALVGLVPPRRPLLLVDPRVD